MKATKELINNGNLYISSVIDAANNLQKDCEDFHIKDMANNLYMTHLGSLQFGDVESGSTYEMPLSAWSLRQLGDKLRIPAGYLERCVANGMGYLAADNMNQWLAKYGQKRNRNAFIRTYQGTVRGILSDRFTPCDAPDILDVITDSIPESNWDIKGSYFNEERLHLRFVSRDRMNIGSDSLFPAIFLDSSDVGRCALRLQFGIYRLACTNGLVVPKVQMLFKQRHIGIDKIEFLQELQSSMGYVPDMIEHAEELVKHAASETIDLRDVAVVDELLGALRFRGRIAKEDAEKIIEFAKTKYDWGTRWGLVNAMTEYAQSKSLEERLEIENAAGLMLVA